MSYKYGEKELVRGCMNKDSNYSMRYIDYRQSGSKDVARFTCILLIRAGYG